MRGLLFLTFLLSFSISATANCEGDACEFLKIVETANCTQLSNSHPDQDLKVRPQDQQQHYAWTISASGVINAIDTNGYCPPDWYRDGVEANLVVVAQESST